MKLSKASLTKSGTAGGGALLLPVVLAACGSSGGAPTAVTAATARTCQQIGAVLADGPDPDSDPVGYAEAQILPLQALHPSDGPLRQAIDGLMAADKAVYAAGQGSSSSPAFQAASKVADKAADRITTLCPGAGT